MTVYTSKITVSVVRAYSGSPPGKRGVKFHYSVNDADTTTVSSTSGKGVQFISTLFSIEVVLFSLNIVTTTTDEDGNTAEPTDPSSTISTSTHAQGTNAQGYPTPPPMPGQDPSVRN